MADLQSLSIYTAAPSATELVNRTRQAEFLAVAIALDVPILSANNNVIASMNTLAAGAGASFAVFASSEEMELNPEEDFLNPSQQVLKLFNEAKSGNKFSRYVTKKIAMAQGFASDDSRQLAAVINEIRILSDETVRQCPFIVSMLAVSWSESPSLGRFWPQVLLEAADEGTLAEYLSAVDIDFNNQLAITMEIGRGLQFLHSQGIVHADLKPTNVLVFSNGFSEEQQELSGKLGITSVRAKLCDFGYAVIIDDYKFEKLFQARIGSYPWMAPELDAEETIELKNLHKTDIYSLGLLAAGIFMNGSLPFEGITPDEVSDIKSRLKEHPDAAVAMVMKNIKSKVSLDEYQEEFIQVFLSGTCVPSQAHRVSLSAIQSYLFLGMMQQLGKGKPAIPLEWFPDLREAGESYHEALQALEKKHSKPKQGETEEDPNVPQILLDLRRMRDEVISIQIGNPEFEETLANAFQDHSLKSAKVRKFRKAWKTDDDFEESQDFFDRMDEVFDRAILKTPDFAFEHTLTAALMPRVARKEVIEDLKATCDSDYIEDPAAPFHLAGAYFNGQVVDPSTVEGLKCLTTSAVMKSPEAVSMILNVFDACEASLPEDIRDDLLATIKTSGTMTFSGAQATLFDHRAPKHIEHNVVLGKIWSKRWPEEYEKWLTTDRRILNTVFPANNNPLYLRAEPKTGQPEFDFDRLTTFKMDGPDKLDLAKRQGFIEEVTRLGCLEACSDYGFTLLQVAAVKDDFEMVKILVLELGASINAYGNTYRWTPLLLACHCGYFEMAKWLVDHGADATLREELHGATILHSLHRFSDRKECEEILDIALSVDIDITCVMKNGMMPLHATFSGWDYSEGAAARLLLEYGADPTRQAQEWDGNFGFFTPIAQAAQVLDVGLILEMISAAESFISIAGLSARRQLSHAKAQAFSALTTRTRFYFMATAGRGYMDKLEATISLLADKDMRDIVDERRDEEERVADTFLAMSIHKARGFFIEALLPSNDEVLKLCGGLIRHGANLLAKDIRGRNSLQVAAHYFPAVLPELISLVEDLPLEKRGGKTIKEILESQDNSGHKLFAQLLLEGYDDERQLAESLRVKYDLQHDYKMREDDDKWTTFVGYMISAAAADGLIPIEHVQYLLDLDPTPEYMCDSEGRTLLSLAVQGFSGSRNSYDLPCHQITGMLLQKYPDYDPLFTRSKTRRTVLHVAAYWSDKTALQMIKDHVQCHCPGKPVPWNLIEGGNTVLDFASLGARLLVYKVDFVKIGLFMRVATERLGLGAPEMDLDGVIEVADTCSPGAKLIRLPVVQLAWRYNNFLLRFYSVRVSSLALEGFEQFRGWFEKRMTKDDPRFYESLNLPRGLYPYKTVTYKHTVPHTNETVEWTRSRCIWTDEECDELREKFSALWDAFFGEDEREFVGKLDK
ncbi:Protein kinase domain-containing protein [Fusarium sp. LHS14.1]|nr:Protein kinase domain-containing protein [Fusarium sp. LHS14.1]